MQPPVMRNAHRGGFGPPLEAQRCTSCHAGACRVAGRDCVVHRVSGRRGAGGEAPLQPWWLGLAVLGRDWSSKPGYHLEGYWVGPVDNVSENSMCCAELKDYWEVSGFRHPLFCINKCLAEYGATTTGWLSYGLGFPALWYGLGPYASPTPSVLFKWPTAALVGVIGLGGYSASLSASGCSTKCYTDVCVAFFAQPQKRWHHYGFFRSCLNGGEFGYHYWACPPPRACAH